MRRVIRLPELPAPGGSMLVEFGLERSEVERMWLMLLAMAVRDRAVSVHWHPWRAGAALAYVIDGVQHPLVRPPVSLDATVSAVIRDIICAGRFRSALGRWLGRSVARRFRCESVYGSSEWCGVWWTAGGGCGTELHRVDLPAEPIIEGPAPGSR